MPDQRDNLKYLTRSMTPEDLEKLRVILLVPHARKCQRCGSTVVLADPLPHRCWPLADRRLDYGACALGWGDSE